VSRSRRRSCGTTMRGQSGQAETAAAGWRGRSAPPEGGYDLAGCRGAGRVGAPEGLEPATYGLEVSLPPSAWLCPRTSPQVGWALPSAWLHPG